MLTTANGIPAMVEIPAELVMHKLPPAVNARLQSLLDKQDSGIVLAPSEKSEALGLVDLAEFISLLNLRAKRKLAHS